MAAEKTNLSKPRVPRDRHHPHRQRAARVGLGRHRQQEHPEHVVNWWGPDGFTTKIEQMDVRPGGAWTLTMRGPDGTEYPNKSVFKEIVRPERITYSLSGGRKGETNISKDFEWLFEVIDENKTRVTIRRSTSPLPTATKWCANSAPSRRQAMSRALECFPRRTRA